MIRTSPAWHETQLQDVVNKPTGCKVLVSKGRLLKLAAKHDDLVPIDGNHSNYCWNAIPKLKRTSPALQDTLSNFASGMMLLIYRPFDVGDFVHAGGVDGKVSHMSLVNTTIRTFDHPEVEFHAMLVVFLSSLVLHFSTSCYGWHQLPQFGNRNFAAGPGT